MSKRFIQYLVKIRLILGTFLLSCVTGDRFLDTLLCVTGDRFLDTLLCATRGRFLDTLLCATGDRFLDTLAHYSENVQKNKSNTTNR